jgi:hypothetical protein
MLLNCLQYFGRGQKLAFRSFSLPDFPWWRHKTRRWQYSDLDDYHPFREAAEGREWNKRMIRDWKFKLKTVPLILAAVFGLGACRGSESGGTGGGGPVGTYYAWMSSEIEAAWAEGFFGQGTRVAIVDQFFGLENERLQANLGPGSKTQFHGEWVADQITMIAPRADQYRQDFLATHAVPLTFGKLNILNLSYAMMAQAGWDTIPWTAREASIISYAQSGSAVVVKAAGNDRVAIGDANSLGRVDYLNRDLIGARSAIFVGALDRNGTPEDLARIASYSNFAGTNVTVQNQFLMVGVRGDLTGLYGTSFAAPIVSGYAAVLGSKFTSATPTQIANQLLTTARTDTIFDYSPAIHGKGEASLSRALAPIRID